MAETDPRALRDGGPPYGEVCLFAAALAWLRFNSLASSRYFLSAERANREAESGKRRSSVVKYRFNGSMTALMNSKNCPASSCLSLPSIEVATDFRPAES